MKSYIALATAALATLSSAVQVRYHAEYNDPSTSLLTTACSDGANGLVTKYGWTTLGQIPGFPHVGNVGAVAGWNSPSCGSCHRVTYNGVSVNMVSMDVQYDMALDTMNELTGGQATTLGTIDVQVEEIAQSECGIGAPLAKERRDAAKAFAA
ncbi:Cerato-platanin-domain-containing protein [Pleomassaria siparia CBS 279.74]|uniref:Cerato-platanin-domain-containing protein n=1 Tax=Pleomassaria siparia CBS 279.74 TaxID=1314801 RepID=A0A6G1JUY5_9PLEO|nr:Cerato-platanin-domain-containing protein [Pleomassaria siparia CBS 279.74]